MNGALQKKSVKEVLSKCHPLGRFTEMEAVNIAETTSDLFNAVLVETPLGMNIQVNNSLCMSSRSSQMYLQCIVFSKNAVACYKDS
jgi:hypothetical protein